jgi:hypothetical protein
MVNVTVDPGVHEASEKVKRPCGKDAGDNPAGGLAGSPETGMNRGATSVQAGPPPVKLAVTLPVPVALAPVNVVTGFTVNVAATEQLAVIGPVVYVLPASVPPHPVTEAL